MSFTRVQGTGIASAFFTIDQPCTFVSNVTSGNTIIVNVSSYRAGGQGINQIADSQVNSYSTDVDYQYFDSVAVLYYDNTIFRTIATSSGPLTVTIGVTGAGFIAFSIEEYSLSSGTFTVNSTAIRGSGTATNPATQPLSLSGSDLVIAGFGFLTTSLTYTSGPSFTLGYTNNTISEIGFISEYYLNTSGSSVTPIYMILILRLLQINQFSCHISFNLN
jgi:hypothetical protein